MRIRANVALTTFLRPAHVVRCPRNTRVEEDALKTMGFGGLPARAHVLFLLLLPMHGRVRPKWKCETEFVASVKPALPCNPSASKNNDFIFSDVSLLWCRSQRASNFLQIDRFLWMAFIMLVHSVHSSNAFWTISFANNSVSTARTAGNYCFLKREHQTGGVPTTLA